MVNNPINFKKVLILAGVLLLFATVCVLDSRYHFFKNVRFLNDNFDRNAYFMDGRWFVESRAPYRDVPSEYPQIPTYMFAIPYFVISWIKPVNEVGYWSYSGIFSLMMLGFLFCLILLLYSILPEHKNRAFLMLLPATLYFTYNRFDIIPSFICLLSLFLVQKKHFVWAAFLLSIGAFTKWYPVLLLPVYLKYSWSLDRRISWKMILVFGLTCLVIVSPTFISGGLDAFLVPYRFHIQRGLETISLPALLNRLFEPLPGTSIQKIFPYLFLGLQFILSPVCLFLKIDRYEKVLHCSILVTAIFILFSRIYSPQWILWLFPSLILSVRSKWDLFGLVAYGIVTYLAFPVVYDYYSISSLQAIVMGAINIAFLVWIMAVSVFYLRKSAGQVVG